MVRANINNIFVLICVLVVLIVTSCADSTSKNELNTDVFPTSEDACDLCVLNEKIYKLDLDRAVAVAKKKSNVFDSLTIIADSLSREYDNLLKKISAALTTRDALVTIDSMCYNSLKFGLEVDNVKRSKMMFYLGNEIILQNSGHYLSEGNYYKNLLPEINDEGDTLTWIDGELVVVDSFHEWRNSRVDKWLDWMSRIDNYLIELVGKKYNEMSDDEVCLLRFKLRLFMDGYEGAVYESKSLHLTSQKAIALRFSNFSIS